MTVACTMNLLSNVSIQCPYCGDAVDVTVDCSVDFQEYIEDCFVCCRPMQLSVSVDENDNPRVSARSENE